MAGIELQGTSGCHHVPWRQGQFAVVQLLSGPSALALGLDVLQMCNAVAHKPDLTCG